ncbi:9866_t:CDS:1, partial [Gigaspora rosea]
PYTIGAVLFEKKKNFDTPTYKSVDRQSEWYQNPTLTHVGNAARRSPA